MVQIIKQSLAHIPVRKLAEKEEIPESIVRVAKIMAMPRALRPSIMKMCEICQIGMPMFDKWRYRPAFTGLVFRLNKDLMANHIPDIVMALKDQALCGNTKSAELFLNWVQDVRDEDPGNITDPDVTEEEVLLVVRQLRKKRV